MSNYLKLLDLYINNYLELLNYPYIFNFKKNELEYHLILLITEKLSLLDINLN